MVHPSCDRFKKCLPLNNRAQQEAPHNFTDIVITSINTEIVSNQRKKTQQAQTGDICYRYLSSTAQEH